MVNPPLTMFRGPSVADYNNKSAFHFERELLADSEGFKGKCSTVTIGYCDYLGTIHKV